MNSRSRACRGVYGWVWVFILIALAGAPAAWSQEDFGQPLNLTRNDPGARTPHMSRGTSGQLAWTQNKKLALIYWDGPDALAIATPNRVLYREWAQQGGWGAAELVSQAVSAGGTEMGARQPAMLTRANGDIFAVWHDHRNCSDQAPANLVNNIEIYGDLRPAGGSFSSQDLRLTETSSDSNGDNGYLPKVALLPDGRMVLAWYDFHWNVGCSEIVLKLSDAAGNFGAATLDDAPRTGASDRAAGDEGQSFTVPAIAVDGNGIVHVVWATGITTTQSSNLYYGRFDPTTKTWLEKTRLHTQAGGQLDPAKLVADPKTGDIWLIYTDFGAASNYEIMIQHRGKDAAAFDSPVRITNNPALQRYPAAAIDSKGTVHLVYVDQSAGGPFVQYAAFDPSSQTITKQKKLTEGVAGNWARPAILADPDDQLYVVWEQAESIDGNGNAGATGLWFTATAPAVNAAKNWNLYE